MGETNLFAVRHVNNIYTNHMDDGETYYYKTLCFKAPSFLPIGDLQILEGYHRQQPKHSDYD